MLSATVAMIAREQHAVDRARGDGRRGQDEAELPELTESDGELQRRGLRAAPAVASAQTTPTLATTTSASRSAIQGSRRRQLVRVDERPDGHEEEHREDVTERPQPAARLIRLVALGHRDPADERGERQRHAEDGRAEPGQQ